MELAAKFELKDLIKLKRVNRSFHDVCEDDYFIRKIKTIGIDEYSNLLVSVGEIEDTNFLKRKDIVRKIRVRSTDQFVTFCLEVKDEELKQNLLDQTKEILKGLNGVITMKYVFQLKDTDAYFSMCRELMLTMEQDITLVLEGKDRSEEKKIIEKIVREWSQELRESIVYIIQIYDDGYVAFDTIRTSIGKYFCSKSLRTEHKTSAAVFIPETENNVTRRIDNGLHVIGTTNNERLDWLPSLLRMMKRYYKDDVNFQELKCSVCGFTYNQYTYPTNFLRVLCKPMACNGDHCDRATAAAVAAPN